MKLRNLTVAALIALAASTASYTFAQTSNFYVDPGTINAWVQLDVGSTALVSAKVSLSSLSIADQFQLPNLSSAALDEMYSIISIEGTPGIGVSMNNTDFDYCAQLVGSDQLRFNFTVKYNQGVDYGAHAVKVVLENQVTHQLTSVILMVTVK